jgi:Reverse transcriptase (RNA-dependent DNA polymerase)/Endonuclease-reverse transcriptase
MSTGGNDHDDRQQSTALRLAPNKQNTRNKKNKWSTLTVISQNVNGYNGGTYSTSKKDQIAYQLNSSNQPTVFLSQETWDNDKTTTEIDGVLFLSNGTKNDNNNERQGGCGIVLSKPAVEGWKLAGQPEPIRPQKVANTARMIGVEVHLPDKKGKMLKFFFISVYMPHSGNKYTTNNYNETLLQLQDTIDKGPPEAILIIGGDFNASIGTNHDQTDNQPVTGKHGNTEKSENGMILIEFMLMNKLVATTTFFEKPNHNTWSWNGNGTNEHQIDHILMKKKDLRRVSDVQTEGGVLSDHKALNATVRIAHYIPKKKHNKNGKCNKNEETKEQQTNQRKRINWSLITQEPKKFNDELEQQLNNDTSYKNFTDAITQAAIKIAADNGNRKRPTWFIKAEDKLNKLIEKRNTAIKHHEKNPSEETKSKIQQARRELKNGKEHAKTTWLQEKIEEIENMNENPRNAWKSIKEITNGFTGHQTQAVTIKMKKSNGKYATSDTENAEVFQQHFEKLYNMERTYDQSIIEEIPPNPTKETLDNQPTFKEIKKALTKMQYEKSLGPNGIPTEAFKNLQGKPLHKFVKIIQNYWNDENMEIKEWQELGFSIIPKSGDLSNPNKWRGIALGDIAAKCVSSIIATRLTEHLVSFGIDEQCGSIFNKGCADATFSLKMALQTLHEHNKESFILFVDLVKAYDSVNRELLWKVLERYGVPPKMIIVLKKLHKNIQYVMKVGKKTTKVKSTCGLKQGDNLGPILFIYLIQAVSVTLDKKWEFDKPDFRRHGEKKR